MPRFIRKVAVAFFVAALCAFLCQGSEGQASHEVNLQGRIRTNQGLTLPTGIRVEVQTDAGVDAAQQFATPEGEFSFPGLPKGIYSVTITAEGFQTYQKTVDLTLTGDSYFLDVYLNPENPQTRGSANLLSRTDRLAPRSARKEESKGEQAVAQHKFAAARTHFEKAVGIYPCYSRAQANLARLLAQDHEVQAAETALRKGLQCDPDYLQSYIELGEILNDEKKYPDAKAVLQEGARRAPSVWQFYYQMGLADSGAGGISQAAADFLKVKQFNPAPPPILYVRLADVYVKEGAYPEAYSALEDYLRADPSGTYAEKVKSVMQRMVTAGLIKPQTAPAPPQLKP
ncbi:MAG: tetratricopeptide repeat protein [Terriglobia bacterium]